MKQTAHPILPWTLTFDPDPHTYTDNEGQKYESVTTFVGRHFEPFNEQLEAKRIALRDGRLELDVLYGWRKKADDAAAFGHRIHEYAEAMVLGSTATNPETDKERRAFAIVDKAMVSLSQQYEFLPPEQIVFDPMFLIAGMIDLPARNRTTGALAILDWKTCESITMDNYRKFARFPISDVPDSKFHHYELQLSIYAWILTAHGWSGYPSEGESVELAMIHVPHVGEEPVWRPCAYREESVTEMMKHRLERVNGEALTTPESTGTRVLSCEDRSCAATRVWTSLEGKTTRKALKTIREGFR